MTLDPAPREVVRDDDDEGVVAERRRPRRREPRLVRRLVQRVPEPARDVVPDAFGGRLGGVLHAVLDAPSGVGGRGEHTNPRNAASRAVESQRRAAKKSVICRYFARLHTSLHRCGQPIRGRPRGRQLAPCEQPFPDATASPVTLWITDGRRRSSILPAPPRPGVRATSQRRAPLHREAHVPAERPSPQAQARVPRAHVDPRRAGDPQAPPRQGAEAPLGLSRSPWSAGSAFPARVTSTPSTGRDGRSRRGTLTLHWFAREEDADGTAAPRPRRPARRRLRRDAEPPQAPASRGVDGRSRTRFRPGRDYVLAARPGLAEAAESPRPRLARRAGARGDRQGAGMKWIGIGLVQAWRHTLRAADAGRHVQVPPELLAVRPRRVPRARARPRRDPRRLAAPPLQPVEPRRRRPRRATESSSVRATGRACARDRVRESSDARSRTSSRTLLEWFHDDGRPLVGLVDRRALVVLVRLVLVPVTVRQIHSMQNLQAHAPEMKEIQQRWKHDRQRQNEELMKFYRENKINPAASCLPIVAPDPDLHLALLRAQGLRAGDLPELSAARASTSSGSWTSRSRRRTAGARSCSSSTSRAS